MRDELNQVIAGWTRLGVLYGASPGRQTPDVESLLLRTAVVLPRFARLLATTVTWLGQFERLICRHRLAVMAREVADPDASAALGLLLELALRQSSSDHLRLALGACRPAEEAKPLFDVDRGSRVLTRLAEAQASDMSRRWGLWTAQPALKPDAIRPIPWVMQENPALHYRAVFGGNLRASILVSLRADPTVGRTETGLAVACGVTRKALREALEHLAFCGLIRRQAMGARTETVLNLSGVAA